MPFGVKVVPIAFFNSISYFDLIQERPHLRKKEVCGFIDEEPEKFKENNVCPKECRDNILLLDGDFNVDDNGKLQITKFGDFQQV